MRTPRNSYLTIPVFLQTTALKLEDRTSWSPKHTVKRSNNAAQPNYPKFVYVAAHVQAKSDILHNKVSKKSILPNKT